MPKWKITWAAPSHLDPRRGDAAPDELNLLFDERGIFLMTKTGAVSWTDDGGEIWRIGFDGAAALPVFSDEGVLYAGGIDWIHYANIMEERILARRSSELYGPLPPGDYGSREPGPDFGAYDYFRFNPMFLRSTLQEIRGAIRRGDIGEKEADYITRLMDIAQSGLKTSGSSLGIVAEQKASLQQRVDAIELLSYIGSRTTIPFMVNIFRSDKDPVVKAAVAAAIGRIGVDPEGTALRAFVEAVNPVSGLQDESVLVAIARSAGSLCRFSGPPLSAGAMRVLSPLCLPSRPPSVQSAAEREIRSLR
jgi:outer membrane protein assembly factor BamB